MIRNTSCSWGSTADPRRPLRLARADHRRQLAAARRMIRERADDRAWWYSASSIGSISGELARKAPARAKARTTRRLQYSIEWCFFTRCQWGEFDTALYELERAWGRTPEFATPIGGGQRPATDRTIRTLDDVHAAVAHYVDNLPYDLVISTATGVSTDIDYRPVSDAEMAAALSRRAQAGPAERDVYASYINEAFLDGAGEARPARSSSSSASAPSRCRSRRASRLSQRTLGQLAGMIARHPGLRFQCFVSSRHANQSLCTLARELPNFSLAGYWWHNFFPDIIRQVIAERLDMLPVNKQVGFFLRCLLRRMGLRESAPGEEATGAGARRKDRARAVHTERRPGNRQGDPVRDAADSAGHGSAKRMRGRWPLPKMAYPSESSSKFLPVVGTAVVLPSPGWQCNCPPLRRRMVAAGTQPGLGARTDYREVPLPRRRGERSAAKSLQCHV